MDTFLQASYSTRAEADSAVQALIERGVRANCITVAEAAEPSVDAPAPVGPGLGFGVTPEATNALIEEHFDEPVTMTGDSMYVVSVDTEGDTTQAMVAREFFGYVA